MTTVCVAPGGMDPGEGPEGQRLLITPQAEEDFEGLIDRYQDAVVRCLAEPIRREKWLKLERYGNAKLWRVRVVRTLRLIVNVQQGVDYVWRIADRKHVYRIVENQDPRVPLTGITVEEFLMKAEETRIAKANGIDAVAADSAPTPVVPSGDGASLAPPLHPLLRALSQYYEDHLEGVLEALSALVHERIDGFESSILAQGEELARLATNYEVVADELVRLAERDLALAGAGSLFEADVDGLRQMLGDRLGELAAAQESDRRNMLVAIGELGRGLDAVARELAEIRTWAPAVEENRRELGLLVIRLHGEHDEAIRHLAAEIEATRATIESLGATVLSIEVEHQAPRNDRRAWSLRDLTTRIAGVLRSAFARHGESKPAA